MKQTIKVISSLIIMGASTNAVVANSQITNLTTKTNSNSFSIKKYEKQKSEDPILTDFSKGGKMAGHKASDAEIKKFSNLVPYYKFFTKLSTPKDNGYTEGPKGGLCEYIALSMLLLYNELFVSSGFFTDAEFTNYFGYDQNNNNISRPIYRYSYWNQPENSLATKLWKGNKSATNIKTGKTLARAAKNWLKDESVGSKIKYNYSSSFMHSSSPEDLLLKYNIPVLVTFTSTGGHCVLIYGYDKITKSYLVNYGWPEHPQVIIQKSKIWSYFSAGYWNSFYLNPSDAQSPKKRFIYQNQLYSWNELNQKGLSFDKLD